MKSYICYNSGNEPEPFVVIADSPHAIAEGVTSALSELCGGVRRGFYRKGADTVVKWRDNMGDEFEIYCIPATVYSSRQNAVAS
jgi:hypothetical protein